MGKSVSGPDIYDVALYWEEIRKQQNCTSSLLIEPDGSTGGSGLVLSIVSGQKDKGEPWDGWVVVTNHSWPNRNNRTFEGFLFAALAIHDGAIAKQTFQTIIDIKA